ncbi:MAG: glycosyltransferase [Bacteroidales bacterium]|jgi:glycosyltransferase involved in cell wall biosynthesis|nr:glycosyltransferase [Bacteroidales bacterium]
MLEFIDTDITPLGTTLLVLFAISLIFLFRFYAKYYKVVGKQKKIPVSENKKPVSVIVSCKNEFEYIKQHLPFWLEQKYPNFEVVAVCDEQDNELTHLLRSFQQRYPILKIVKISSKVNFFDEEKFALSIGAKEASYDYLIFTTISSRPTTEHCIDYMQSAFKDNTDVVIGHSCFDISNSNVFPRYLYADNAIRYIAPAINGYPIVGSHRLLGYRKDFFLQTGGYTNSYSLRTGVYDFLSAANPNVTVQVSPESIVKIDESFDFNIWSKEEKNYFVAFSRSHSKAKKEEVTYRLSILSAYASAIFFLMLTEQAWNSILLIFFLILVLAKNIVQLIFTAKAMKTVMERYVWVFAPLFELFCLPGIMFSFFRIKRKK